MTEIILKKLTIYVIIKLQFLMNKHNYVIKIVKKRLKI